MPAGWWQEDGLLDQQHLEPPWKRGEPPPGRVGVRSRAAAQAAMEHILTEAHGNQLAEYLRFLRRKRDTAIAEVAAEFKEVRQSRLFEENYSTTASTTSNPYSTGYLQVCRMGCKIITSSILMVGGVKRCVCIVLETEPGRGGAKHGVCG